MNSPPDPAGLPALLEAFRAALIAPEHEATECTAFAAALADDGIPALARLRVYRNSSRLIQREALSRTYSVLRRRVGDEYFAQLARDYLAAHPSPSGDLHWIGAAFAPWLADHLGEGDYRWLADLARLEWACERALAAADAAPLALQSLGRVPAERLDAAVLRLHPSLQFVSSPWPYAKASADWRGLRITEVPSGGGSDGRSRRDNSAFRSRAEGLSARVDQYSRYVRATTGSSTTCTTFECPYTPLLEKFVDPVRTATGLPAFNRTMTLLCDIALVLRCTA